MLILTRRCGDGIICRLEKEYLEITICEISLKHHHVKFHANEHREQFLHDDDMSYVYKLGDEYIEIYCKGIFSTNCRIGIIADKKVLITRAEIDQLYKKCS